MKLTKFGVKWKMQVTSTKIPKMYTRHVRNLFSTTLWKKYQGRQIYTVESLNLKYI